MLIAQLYPLNMCDSFIIRNWNRAINYCVLPLVFNNRILETKLRPQYDPKQVVGIHWMVSLRFA